MFSGMSTIRRTTKVYNQQSLSNFYLKKKNNLFVHLTKEYLVIGSQLPESVRDGLVLPIHASRRRVFSVALLPQLSLSLYMLLLLFTHVRVGWSRYSPSPSIHL